MTDRPDVLFLVVDSVRSDRVSTYGHDRPTTPTLDSFAETATVCEQAYAPAPWTLPSHCSMFTGLFPSEHRVTGGFADSTSTLSEESDTVTERLTERGYRTAGFSNNPWVGQLSGLDRGFEEFVEWDLERSRTGEWGSVPRGERLQSAAHTLLGQLARQPVFLLKRRYFTESLVSRACRWLERGGDEPTFTFLNLMEAHSPYFPPAAAFRSLGLPEPSILEPRLLNTKLLAYVMGRRELTDGERRRVMEYYDASLRYQDGQVGRLLSALERTGRFDDTLVIVCSDHGKTLGEYDRDETPPHYTRQHNVNVPLVVKAPDQRSGRRLAEPVELRDVHDWIVETVDGELPDPPRPTASGTALVEDFVPHAGRELPDERTRWQVLADAQYRFVTDGADTSALFDISEGRDQRVEEPEEALLERYRQALADRTEGLSVADDGETRQLGRSTRSQLQDLGYM